MKTNANSFFFHHCLWESYAFGSSLVTASGSILFSDVSAYDIKSVYINIIRPIKYDSKKIFAMILTKTRRKLSSIADFFEVSNNTLKIFRYIFWFWFPQYFGNKISSSLNLISMYAVFRMKIWHCSFQNFLYIPVGSIKYLHQFSLLNFLFMKR